jgi:hypothetical protein
MGAAFVVLPFPLLELPGEIGSVGNLRPSVELLFVRAMAPFAFAVALRAPGRDVSVGDAQVQEMPHEVGSELRPAIGLDALDGDREAPAHLLYEVDGVLDRETIVDLEHAIPGRLINGSEPVKATRVELEMLDIHLDRPAGTLELPTPPRPER